MKHKVTCLIRYNKETTWKRKYPRMDNSMNRKGKGKLTKKWRDLRMKVQTETWNILAFTDPFLDQKRVNVCEHVVKMVSSGCFWKVPPGVVILSVFLFSWWKPQCWLKAPISYHRRLCTPAMSTESSQVGVTLFPSFYHIFYQTST